MSRKTTQLTMLQTRKQLLLVESELNRMLFAVECRDARLEFEEATRQIMQAVSLFESAGRIAESLAGFFEKPKRETREDGNKPGWLSMLLNGAREGFSLWSSIRSHRQ